MPSTVLPAAAPLLAELEEEAQSTRRLLAAAPKDKWDFKPHERSLSLGQLAQHLATIPGFMVTAMSAPTFDVGEVEGPSQADPATDVLETFDAGLEQAREKLTHWTEADLAANWSLSRHGQPLMQMRRAAALRALLFNHLYHHRGQLSVYLRMLDVPVPSVYGPTADEDPFA